MFLIAATGYIEAATYMYIVPMTVEGLQPVNLTNMKGSWEV